MVELFAQVILSGFFNTHMFESVLASVSLGGRSDEDGWNSSWSQIWKDLLATDLFIKNNMIKNGLLLLQEK